MANDFVNPSPELLSYFSDRILDKDVMVLKIKMHKAKQEEIELENFKTEVNEIIDTIQDTLSKKGTGKYDGIDDEEVVDIIEQIFKTKTYKVTKTDNHKKDNRYGIIVSVN